MKDILKNLSSGFAETHAKSEKTPVVGICLSGGGALGYAHIGVLQALEDCDIYPDIISGSSMGSIIGLGYAAGKSPQEMLQLIKNDKLYRITSLINFSVPFWKTAGLSNQASLKKLVGELCAENTFESLKKPFYVCVSNLSKGEIEYISAGNRMNEWIAASSSIPGIFSATKINDELYVDGGLMNNMPAQPLKEKCDVIIGSDVLPHSSVKKKMKMQNVFVSSVRIMEHVNSTEGRKLCDYIIEPKAVEKYHEFSFDAYQAIYESGYNAVSRFLIEHPEILKLRRNPKS